ncbi:hypothetical protein ABPG75_008353 [Micractinium tetrahymenae]
MGGFVQHFTAESAGLGAVAAARGRPLSAFLRQLSPDQLAKAELWWDAGPHRLAELPRFTRLSSLMLCGTASGSTVPPLGAQLLHLRLSAVEVQPSAPAAN